MSSGHVLSIQSHVVHGYVGNKAATFPLQLLGFDVDPLNTVQFSNHTGYPAFKGERLQGDQLWDLFNGLLANGLTDYTHVLTGYIGSPSFLETTVKLIKELKRLNPGLIYVCDPVMGDDGKLFVSAELVPLFCEKLVPLSDIVVPNHFEAELLSGVTIKTIEDAKLAIDKVHQKGVKRVVLTSVYLAGEADSIFVVGSQQHPDGSTTQFSIKIPKLPMSFTGTGDLFAALLLARSQQHDDNLRFACEQVIGSMHKVLRRTLEASREALSRVADANLETAFQRKACELRLIESKKDIEEPEVALKSVLI